jgi:hypothetical protein
MLLVRLAQNRLSVRLSSAVMLSRVGGTGSDDGDWVIFSPCLNTLTRIM